MNIKKLCAILSSAAILAGCTATGNTTPTQNPEVKPEATAEATVEATAETNANAEQPASNLGGWTLNTSYHAYLTDDEIALFKKATEGLVGVGYEPVAILADQVVAGTNHAYLAMAKTVTAEPKDFWAIVTVYEDLNGNASILAINEMDPLNLKTVSEAPDSGIAGGWTIREAGGKPVMMPDENANAAVEAVMNAVPQLTLKPVALIASQLVSGNNYLVLERGNSEGSDFTQLYVTTIYRDLKGNAEVTNNQFLDLISYVTPQN